MNMPKGFPYKGNVLQATVIFLAILLFSFSPVFGLEITVMQKVVVSGDTVRLGDIAQFDPDDDSRVSELGNIKVSASPLPGAESAVSKDLIIYKINPQVSGQKDILVKLPETMIVKRSAQYIGADRMEEIFRDYVKGNSAWSEGDVQFESVSAPSAVVLPEGSLHWDVRDKSNNDFIGNVSLIIDFFVDGRLVKKIPVSGKVSIRKETLKAARKIERGQIITAEDIVAVNEKSLHYRRNSVVDMEAVIGKRAVRTIRMDQTILSDMLENPPLVKKGEKVIIKAESAELKVTVVGEALQDGYSEEQVEVVNLQSGKKISATVKGSGLVEVYF